LRFSKDDILPYASVRVFTHRNFRSRCVLVREDTNQGEEQSGPFVDPGRHKVLLLHQL